MNLTNNIIYITNDRTKFIFVFSCLLDQMLLYHSLMKSLLLLVQSLHRFIFFFYTCFFITVNHNPSPLHPLLHLLSTSLEAARQDLFQSPCQVCLHIFYHPSIKSRQIFILFSKTVRKLLDLASQEYKTFLEIHVHMFVEQSNISCKNSL